MPKIIIVIVLMFFKCLTTLSQVKNDCIIKTTYQVKVNIIDSIMPFYTERNTKEPYSGWLLSEKSGVIRRVSLMEVVDGRQSGIIYTYKGGRTHYYYLYKISVGLNYDPSLSIRYKKNSKKRAIKKVYIYEDNSVIEILYKRHSYVVFTSNFSNDQETKKREKVTLYNNEIINFYHINLLFPVYINLISDLFEADNGYGRFNVKILNDGNIPH